MDTMIYASFGAFRQCIAEKSNEPELPEAEFTPLDLAQITATLIRNGINPFAAQKRA
jgi:hypothetical protein